jgi:hypothetical protein
MFYRKIYLPILYPFLFVVFGPQYFLTDTYQNDNIVHFASKYVQAEEKRRCSKDKALKVEDNWYKTFRSRGYFP